MSGREFALNTGTGEYGWAPVAPHGRGALLGYMGDGRPVYSTDPGAADGGYHMYDPRVAAYKRYDQMQPGDVIAWAGAPRAQILRLAEPWTDPHGRELRAHWCRALDGSGAEGWMPYGPDGSAPVELKADGWAELLTDAGEVA